MNGGHPDAARVLILTASVGAAGLGRALPVLFHLRLRFGPRPSGAAVDAPDSDGGPPSRRRARPARRSGTPAAPGEGVANATVDRHDHQDPPALASAAYEVATTGALRTAKTVGLQTVWLSRWAGDWDADVTADSVAQRAQQRPHAIAGATTPLHDYDRYAHRGSRRTTAAAPPIILAGLHHRDLGRDRSATTPSPTATRHTPWRKYR